MKTIFLFLTLLLAANITMAQSQTNILESSPYIQVSGEAEKEVIPDEIYLQFTLQEHYDGKNKVQLDDLEKELKQLLRKNDFNLENLTLADANADYITIKRKKKDVLASKDFEAKVETTGQLTNVWNILDEVQAQNAYVSRVDHSQMEELKKEVKIMAVKNAKEKATYLLSAVDEKVGASSIHSGTNKLHTTLCEKISGYEYLIYDGYGERGNTTRNFIPKNYAEIYCFSTLCN